MSMDKGCFYCTGTEPMQSLMIKICELRVSTVFLLKDQTMKGRCIVAFNDHKGELFQLTEQEKTDFMNDLCKVSGVLNELFSPDKINYAAYGDSLPHLHFHLVPKYKNGFEWGKPFSVGLENKMLLTDREYKERIQLIHDKLKA